MEKLRMKEAEISRMREEEAQRASFLQNAIMAYVQGSPLGTHSSRKWDCGLEDPNICCQGKGEQLKYSSFLLNGQFYQSEVTQRLENSPMLLLFRNLPPDSVKETKKQPSRPVGLSPWCRASSSALPQPLGTGCYWRVCMFPVRSCCSIWIPGLFT